MVSRHFSSFLVILAFISVKVYSSEVSVDATDNEEEDISHAFGFEVEVTKKAKYCMKKAQENDLISFHIESKVKETDYVFESSYEKSVPHAIQLGQKQVIGPIEKVMFNICSGDKRRLTMPYAMAFGNESYNSTDGGSIDKNSTLIFDLEVVDVQKPPNVQRLFKRLDKEKTGKIEIDKLIRTFLEYATKPGFPINLPGEQFGEMLESAFYQSDKDGDNHMTVEEFMNSIGFSGGLPSNQKNENEVNNTEGQTDTSGDEDKTETKHQGEDTQTDTSGDEDKTETKHQGEDTQTANQGYESKTDDERKDEL